MEWYIPNFTSLVSRMASARSPWKKSDNNGNIKVALLNQSNQEILVNKYHRHTYGVISKLHYSTALLSEP